MPSRTRQEKKLRVHPLVESLANSPGGLPDDAVAFHGLPGGGEDGEWRLYDNTLSSFVSFQEADILHSQNLSTEENPLGGTRVWLKATAPVRQVRIESVSVPAQFLAGAVTRRFGRPASPLAQARGGLMGEWTLWNCSRDWGETCTQDAKVATCGDDQRTCQAWKTCNPAGNPDDPCVGTNGWECTRWWVCPEGSVIEMCGNESHLDGHCPKPKPKPRSGGGGGLTSGEETA